MRQDGLKIAETRPVAVGTVMFRQEFDLRLKPNSATLEQYPDALLCCRITLYPAMIDTLDAYSLLVEARVADIVLVNSGNDVRDKMDLVVERRSERVYLAFVGPTAQASKNRRYTQEHCPTPSTVPVVTIYMPLSRPKRSGNQRWLRIKAFALLFQTKLPVGLTVSTNK